MSTVSSLRAIFSLHDKVRTVVGLDDRSRSKSESREVPLVVVMVVVGVECKGESSRFAEYLQADASSPRTHSW